MKIPSLLLVCGVMMLTAATARASDPCASILCLAGKLQGQGGGAACSQPIADYFGILVFARHHRFDASGTAAARSSFLNQCNDGGANQQIKNNIGNAYGTLLHAP